MGAFVPEHDHLEAGYLNWWLDSLQRTGVALNRRTAAPRPKPLVAFKQFRPLRASAPVNPERALSTAKPWVTISPPQPRKRTSRRDRRGAGNRERPRGSMQLKNRIDHTNFIAFRPASHGREMVAPLVEGRRPRILAIVSGTIPAKGTGKLHT